MSHRGIRRSLVAALILLVLLALLGAAGWFGTSYFSFESGFERAKPALEQYAAEVLASDPSRPLPPPPARLGAFTARGAERLPHGFLFFCDYGNPLDANGLAYSTEPLPSAAAGGRDFYTPIEGNWYRVWRN